MDALETRHFNLVKYVKIALPGLTANGLSSRRPASEILHGFVHCSCGLWKCANALSSCYNICMSSSKSKLLSNFLVAVAIILIWRGIWYVLDYIDIKLLGGTHVWSALVGIGLGILILYLPDKDLKELGKL